MMMMFTVLLLLSVEVFSIFGTPMKASIVRAKRSTCDSQYSQITSTHTMCKTDVGTEVSLSASQKQAIVDKHNNYRSNVSPTATNLVKLVWDEDIAVIAAKWARQCVLGHDAYAEREVPKFPGVYIGQNVAAGYTDTVAATVDWHNEVQYFEYGVGNTSAEMVKHYTQVVGWRAVRIGCGEAICTGTTYPTYQVCNYAWGQMDNDGKKPYTSGASCSECPSGKCSNNLCDCDGKVCLNGGTLDTSTCTCQCVGVYHGDTCQLDCNGKWCENGGTLNIPACTCSCGSIFSGDTCQNVNCPVIESGWCTTVPNYCPQGWFLQYCPMLCNICPRPAACPNKQCQNGAELQEDCTCDCYPSYSGDLCQTLNCPSSDASYCSSWTNQDCDQYWNVPFYCPKLCNVC